MTEMTSHDQHSFVAEIDLRISQAESRLLKWLVTTAIGFIVTVFIAAVVVGRLMQQLEDHGRRLQYIELNGTPVVRQALERIEARQAATSERVAEILAQLNRLTNK